MRLAPPDRRTATAADLLTRVFAGLDVPLTFRLWDGTDTHVGAPGKSACAVVFRSPPVLRRLLRRPTPLRFGEAFIAGDIDIEGDLFAAMDVASHVEHLRVPLATRLAVMAGLLRL
jgi:cyclopropane-fatty-acyl-phospholipid synthase